MKNLESLLALLQVKKIDKGVFTGNSQDVGSGMVFGGQVLLFLTPW